MVHQAKLESSAWHSNPFWPSEACLGVAVKFALNWAPFSPNLIKQNKTQTGHPSQYRASADHYGY